MAAARILSGIIYVAFACSAGMPGSDLLRIARAEIGVREKSGRNDGKRVEQYLHCVGLNRGEPYCAAFVSFCFKQAGHAAPRTGWSPDLFPSKTLVKQPVPGNVFGVYFPELKRIAHCGLVSGLHTDWVMTIEGNTNASGGRDGEGVYARRRHKRTIRCYADWLP